MAPTLSLVIPGLLPAWPDRNAPGFPRPQTPALERLLARAAVRAFGAADADATLFALFDLPGTGDLPVAPVTRLADGADPGDAWWLRADPVFLRPDLHAVLLFDARTLKIEKTEAQALAAAFNRTFSADGLRLQTPCPDRWYLRLAADPDLRAFPLIQAIGRDVTPLLPTGAAGPRWTALLTEIQMLFHGAPVNAEREARGRPPINSVWFWGGGRLPQGARSPAEALYVDDALVHGLARLAGTAVGPAPAAADHWQEGLGEAATSLVVLEDTRYDGLDDEPLDWSEHLKSLEENWFDPCLKLLRQKALAALELYPCNGRAYRITPATLRHFWRPIRPLSHYLR